MAAALRARGVALLLGSSLALSPATTTAEMCQVVDVDFVPANLSGVMKLPLQIVAWIEDGSGNFIETIFITRQVGTYGLGNRPGRHDFNSGPMWPYGRRVTVFPVWANRYNAARATAKPPYNHPPFPEVVFQDGQDSNLSHSYSESSPDRHFCRPLLKTETYWGMADAGTCASATYTDKGILGPGTSLYPPRADIAKHESENPSVEQYEAINPFDAISGATPPNDEPAVLSWAIPQGFPVGDYVMWLEVSRETDHNATYSKAVYPPPIVTFGDYGEPYRGQPSILYKVPFTISTIETIASTATYEGYGDPAPDGLGVVDGVVRPPDPTITVDVVGSGAQRLALTPGGYRVRVTASPEFDFAPPAAPDELQATEVTSHTATVLFAAPGDDGQVNATYQSSASSDIRTAIFETFSGNVISPADKIGRLKAFSTVNLALGADWERFRIEAFVSNVFDERGQLSRFVQCGSCGQRPYIVPIQPRTVGLRAGADF